LRGAVLSYPARGNDGSPIFASKALRRRGVHGAGPKRFHQAVFTLAAVAFGAHLLDTLVSGIPVTLELDAALASGVVALAVAGLYSRMPPTLRAGIAVSLGVPWLYGCLHYHVIPTVERGLSATDLTGIVAAVAAVALLAIGLPPLLHLVRQRPRARSAPEVANEPDRVAVPPGGSNGAPAAHI
jgi:hypothetical protein